MLNNVLYGDLTGVFLVVNLGVGGLPFQLSCWSMKWSYIEFYSSIQHNDVTEDIHNYDQGLVNNTSLPVTVHFIDDAWCNSQR